MVTHVKTIGNKLAIDGGKPVRERPFPRWPHYAPEEIEKVADILRSGRVNYWTGDEARKFEREFAHYTQRRHGIALANGTVALEFALRGLGIGSDDEVIVTSRSFVASASVIVQCGALPVFVDVDPESQNMTAATIAPAITSKTRALLLVHLAGWPCEMQSIMELANRHGLNVLEDCAQAHGATYDGQPVGSFGDAAAFSFCQDKIISTCGEGGILVTNDSSMWEAAWAYKDHGKSYEAVYQRQHPVGFRWVHESIGTNWRVTEPQAAVGRIQLKKLDSWVEKRRHAAMRLTECFSKLPGLRVTRPPDHVGHSYYKYYAFVRPDALCAGWTRDRIMSAIGAEGIPCHAGSCPEIYRERAFHGIAEPAERLPVARVLGETSLMFEVHPTLTDGDLSDVCRAVEKVMAAAAV